MTQDERWLARYNVVMNFLKENHRNPSKHLLLRKEAKGFCSFLLTAEEKEPKKTATSKPPT